MVGFPFFRRPTYKNAQQQYDFVSTNFHLPGASDVGQADLIFVQNTYDKNGNGVRTDDGVTHVGLAVEHEKWFAAESKMVDFYCYQGFKDAHPGDDCKVSSLWSKFYSYGSIF